MESTDYPESTHALKQATTCRSKSPVKAEATTHNKTWCGENIVRTYMPRVFLVFMCNEYYPCCKTQKYDLQILPQKLLLLSKRYSSTCYVTYLYTKQNAFINYIIQF